MLGSQKDRPPAPVRRRRVVRVPVDPPVHVGRCGPVPAGRIDGRFAVHSIVVSRPLGPFRENPKTALTLVGTHSHKSGVVVLNYTVGAA